MWSDTNKHTLNIILREIQINPQGDALPCTSARLRWQWLTPQRGRVWCTCSSHTLLQHGTAAFDVSANSPKLNIQLSCNLVVPLLLYPRGLKTSVPMNLVHLLYVYLKVYSPCARAVVPHDLLKIYTLFFSLNYFVACWKLLDLIIVDAFLDTELF